MNDPIPLYATKLADDADRIALGLHEGVDLMVIAMPPLPDPFARKAKPMPHPQTVSHEG